MGTITNKLLINYTVSLYWQNVIKFRIQNYGNLQAMTVFNSITGSNIKEIEHKLCTYHLTVILRDFILGRSGGWGGGQQLSEPSKLNHPL